MRVGYIGAKQAGVVGLLTVLAAGLKVGFVVAHDEMVRGVALTLGLETFQRVRELVAVLPSDVLLIVNVHGREYVPVWLLATCPLAINVHPCLSQYPGRDPIGRLLADGATKASVGVHRMTSVIDQGEILAETYVDVHGLNTREAVYNKLYPVYVTTMIEALGRLGVVLT